MANAIVQFYAKRIATVSCCATNEPQIKLDFTLFERFEDQIHWNMLFYDLVCIHLHVLAVAVKREKKSLVKFAFCGASVFEMH